MAFRLIISRLLLEFSPTITFLPLAVTLAKLFELKMTVLFAVVLPMIQLVRETNERPVVEVISLPKLASVKDLIAATKDFPEFEVNPVPIAYPTPKAVFVRLT